MKNILSENLLRFGVKNLTESQKRALTLKSIMETIDAHGLRNEVRTALTEADAPKDANAVIAIRIGDINNSGYKLHPDSNEILVMQSPTSISEASTILGGIMKLVGQGNAESPQMISLVKKITKNNYPAILWKVRYGSTFKSNTGANYETVCDWLSKSVDKPAGGGYSKSYDEKGTFGVVSNYLRGTKTAEAIQAHLDPLNDDEYFTN